MHRTAKEATKKYTYDIPLETTVEKNTMLSRYFCIPQRWVFTILANIGLCLANIYAGFLSITIIEMVERTGVSGKQESGNCEKYNNVSLTNQTYYHIENNTPNQLYPWDEYTQGIILSSLPWSFTVTHFFYGPLAERFGGKHIVGLGVFVQAFFTFITPFTLNWGGYMALIITRILVGAGCSATVPGSCTMIPRWSTPADRTRIGNIIFAGLPLGYFFGNILPALIIKYVGAGWQAVFYILGIIGMIWFPFWLIFVHENPEVHPFISDAESQYLQNNTDVEKKKIKLPPAPWKHIVMCKEFWAFTISWIGSSWAFSAMASGLPRYMGNVVKLSLESNGYFSSLPYIFKTFDTMATTWITEKIIGKQWMTLTNIRRLFTTIATTGPGVFLLLASYAECDTTLVVMMFMIGITLTGSFYASTVMNPLDLSPNYAGSIMSAGAGIASIVGIITPYLIGVLTPNSTLAEWRIVFWIIFFFAIASNVVYLFWYRAEVQAWNDPNFERNKAKITKAKQEASDVELF